MKKTDSVAPAPRLEPKKKRTRLAPEVRREQILAAALVEFNALGFTAASISKIARRAGTVKSNIYVHFTDKDNMFETLLEGLMARSQESLSWMQDVPNAEEFVERLVESGYAALTDDTIAIARLLITEGHRVPHLLAKWSAANMQARVDRQALVDRFVAEGKLNPSPLTEHFSLVMAPLVYAAVAQMVLGKEKAAGEVQAVKDTHRKLLAMLLPPAQSKT
ncbi:TetR/AcrR family transcriptional regulator [Rhodoferax ferrireducens]|uniref:TetR/AcrR family transcriptional regulator n=1 Tax=Rhodoferax ferrireducens TaxID=192843 RepID=UPI000E0D1A3A|nr:TetR/AcrR family transcriptional regulator [Rhodoferax ferrireducens]